MNLTPYIYVCPECGNPDVTSEVMCYWDVVKQDWVVGGTPYDNAYCPDCEMEVRDKKRSLYFVFGSNLAGRHGAGAARNALDYGAVYGQGEGLQGHSYALPTKTAELSKMSLKEIQKHVNTFLAFASTNPDKYFQVTQVGCGLAGHTAEEIAPMFNSAPINCLFDSAWAPILGNHVKYWGGYSYGD